MGFAPSLLLRLNQKEYRVQQGATSNEIIVLTQRRSLAGANN
jgi:hypothetical protein